jgi:hypothetical protein
MGKPLVTPEGILKPFSLKEFQAFVQPDDKGDRRREIRLVLRKRLPFLLEVEIKFGGRGCIGTFPGFIAHTDKGKPGGQHETFLRTAYQDIDAPVIHLQVMGNKGGYGVNDEYGIFIFPDNGGDGTDVMVHTGRCFRCLHKDSFDRRVFFERRFNVLGFDSIPPVDFYFLNGKRIGLADLCPPFPEIPCIDDKGFVPRVEEIVDSADHAACPGRADDKDIALCLAEPLESLFGRIKNRQEVRGPVMYYGHGHRSERFRRNRRRSWSQQITFQHRYLHVFSAGVCFRIGENGKESPSPTLNSQAF